MTPNLPKDVLYILDNLLKSGYEAFIVGGCVRDCLLCRVPKDWDITTSAKPEQVKAIFSHTFDTGIAHGTVTVVLNNINYEITTYRIDGEYHDCRRPDNVLFTSHLEQDLLRRDFTMNAIAYRPDCGFKDPYNGMEDIKNQIIRGVGDSAKRFQEDALRMLRCLRFSAQLGFAIEPKTYEALVQNANLIKKISSERILAELEKLFLSPYHQKIPLLWQSGLMAILSPQLEKYIADNQYDIVRQIGVSPTDRVIRFSLLLQHCPINEALVFLKSLKPDNKLFKEVKVVLENLHIAPPPKPFEIKEIASAIGIARLLTLFKVQQIAGVNPNASISMQILENAINNNECITLDTLALNGTDLLAIGIKNGKPMGDALKKLLCHVHLCPLENTPKQLLEYATKHLL